MRHSISVCLLSNETSRQKRKQKKSHQRWKLPLASSPLNLHLSNQRWLYLHRWAASACSTERLAKLTVAADVVVSQWPGLYHGKQSYEWRLELLCSAEHVMWTCLPVEERKKEKEKKKLWLLTARVTLFCGGGGGHLLPDNAGLIPSFAQPVTKRGLATSLRSLIDR